jgi:hypothetical protein
MCDWTDLVALQHGLLRLLWYIRHDSGPHDDLDASHNNGPDDNNFGCDDDDDGSDYN